MVCRPIPVSFSFTPRGERYSQTSALSGTSGIQECFVEGKDVHMQTVKSLFLRLYDSVAQTIDLTFKWHKMPVPIGLAILAGLRNILRAKNLSGTYTVKSPYPQVTSPAEEGQRYLTTRTADGTYNDTDIPAMGSAN